MKLRPRLESRIVVRDGCAVNERALRTYRKPCQKSYREALVRVIWPSGTLAYKTSEHHAHSLHREGLGDGVFSRKGKLICVKLTRGIERPSAGVNYITDADSATNITNVFAFVPLAEMPRHLFRQVQTDCLVPFRAA